MLYRGKEAAYRMMPGTRTRNMDGTSTSTLDLDRDRVTAGDYPPLSPHAESGAASPTPLRKPAASPLSPRSTPLKESSRVVDSSPV